MSRPNPIAADIAWVAHGEFCEPETVLPLPDDTLLVSNVCGFRKSGNGFLTLLDRDGQALNWRIVDGLDAPLGMALVADRIYVVDNNRLIVLRWPGYEPLETIDLHTTVANDVAVAHDGVIYVTDTADHQVIRRLPDGTQSMLTGRSRFTGANHGYAPGLQLALIPTGFDNTVIAIRTPNAPRLNH